MEKTIVQKHAKLGDGIVYTAIFDKINRGFYLLTSDFGAKFNFDYILAFLNVDGYQYPRKNGAFIWRYKRFFKNYSAPFMRGFE